MERGQLNKVVDELKLETSDLDGNQNQAEIGRLAKLRYLVVGSISRLGGVTVNAGLGGRALRIGGADSAGNGPDGRGFAPICCRKWRRC